MTIRMTIWAAFLAMASSARAQGERIVSLNLCLDQMLIALAPQKIASLSPLSRDPAFSFFTDKAAAFPQNAGRGEALLLDPPDLVLAGPFEGRAKRDWLARYEIPLLVSGAWASLEEGRAQIREIAARIDAKNEGETLVGEIDRALSKTRQVAPPRSILVLQRRGYTPGKTGILDEILRHLGLVPITERLGLQGGGTVALERLIADPPDYLLLGESDRLASDQGSSLLWHQALLRAVPVERRLFLPDRFTICAGPATPAAIEALAQEVRSKVR